MKFVTTMAGEVELMADDINPEDIQRHVKDGNYHAALNLALSGLNECRRNDNQGGVDDFLKIIKDITQTLANEFGSKESPQD